MSTAGFTEMWVENRRACHCKHRHPHLLIESWSPAALGCTSIITAQEDVIWPSIPFVTYPKPVFWLLSLISLLYYLFPLPHLVWMKQILPLASCGAVSHTYYCLILSSYSMTPHSSIIYQDMFPKTGPSFRRILVPAAEITCPFLTCICLSPSKFLKAEVMSQPTLPVLSSMACI